MASNSSSLLGEVVVDRALGHIRRCRHAVHAGAVEAVFAELADGRLHDGIALAVGQAGVDWGAVMRKFYTG